MKSVNTPPFSSSVISSSSSSSPYSFSIKIPHRKTPIQLSFSPPNRRRSRAPQRNISNAKKDSDNKRMIASASDDQTLGLVVDYNQIWTVASSRFQQYLVLGQEACSDLRNVVRFDDERRLVVSCRRSTARFVGSLVPLWFLGSILFMWLNGLWSGLRVRFRSALPNVTVRRDRSLGGREVIVGAETSKHDVRAPSSDGNRILIGDKLPKWWPATVARETTVPDKDVYQRDANRLVQVIMDDRTAGKDTTEDDVIQLRRICRIGGVQVNINPTNARDSFYRTSVDFILNSCSRTPCRSTVSEIDGEDALHFVSGLAENIKLENVSAARMVSAAVASRTRSHFLQAWALEMQGKHSEAVSELSKICSVHRVFPPEKSSREMEMVARGIEKLLKAQEREFLWSTLVGVCGEDSPRSAAEALGLMLSHEDIGDKQANKS